MSASFDVAGRKLPFLIEYRALSKRWFFAGNFIEFVPSILYNESYLARNVCYPVASIDGAVKVKAIVTSEGIYKDLISFCLKSNVNATHILIHDCRCKSWRSHCRWGGWLALFRRCLLLGISSLVFHHARLPNRRPRWRTVRQQLFSSFCFTNSCLLPWFS